MVKNVPRKCIFCGGSKLSRTHIWPNWLEKLLSPGTDRSEELEKPTHLSPTHPKIIRIREVKLRQGSIFAQKPYLACIACNTGWMKHLEDEMLKFAKPLFASVIDIAIGRQQLQIISGWASLITILAEYIDTSQGSITVSQSERLHLKNYLTPPDNWSIFAASLDSKIWNARYRHQSLMLADFANLAEYYAAFGQNRPPNTQISSFGIEKIFVQVFSCPNQRFTTHFRIWAEASGLVQLWPIPSGVWPSAKFPTTLVLKDESAEELSNAYNDRIKIMTQAPLLGGLNVAERSRNHIR